MGNGKDMKAATFFHHVRQACFERGEALSDTAKWLLDLGYDAVEVDADDAQGVRQLLDEGLKISSIYRFYDWTKDADEGRMTEHIRIAGDLGADKIMAIPGFYTGKAPREEEKANMIRAMAKLCELASEEGLTLTIEDFDDGTSPISTVEGMSDFLRGIPELKVTLDAGNFIYSAQDVLEAEKVFRGRIAHAHLKDRLWSRTGPGETKTCIDGRTLYPCATGAGDIPMGTVVDRLIKNGYSGYLVTEFFGAASYSGCIEESIMYLERMGWIA